jgi:hypothetical protein
VQFLIKKILNFFAVVNFFKFLVIKTPDLGWYSAEMPDPESNTKPEHNLLHVLMRREW